MPRRLAEGMLSCCVVLLMFGTQSVAGDEVVFDLSGSGTDARCVEAPALSRPLNSAVDADLAIEVEECPPGMAGDPALGWWPRPAPHFQLPTRSYSLFRSPVSYGWGYWERCAPTPWTPRGDGFPQRSSHYRMDYRPYVLQHHESTHGPAFYRRHNLYPCEECPVHGAHLQHYSQARGACR